MAYTNETNSNTSLSSSHAYTSTAIAFHWVMALIIVANFALGVTMSDMPRSPEKLQFVSWHKWVGITLLGLVTLRFLWRAFADRPPLLPSAAWQRRVAKLTHFLMYVLMFAIPISGWLMSSAGGFPVVYLGLFPLPDLVAKDEQLFDLLKDVHEILNYTLLGLVILHVLGVIKHQFVDRDATLARMVPWLKPRPR